jgi:Ca2+/H+ antiporter
MEKEKISQKTWFTVLFLIIFFPVGLFTMWKYKKFNKVARIIITAIFVISFVSAFLNQTTAQILQVSHQKQQRKVRQRK